jgi:hypothetical protein
VPERSDELRREFGDVARRLGRRRGAGVALRELRAVHAWLARAHAYAVLRDVLVAGQLIVAGVDEHGDLLLALPTGSDDGVVRLSELVRAQVDAILQAAASADE